MNLNSKSICRLCLKCGTFKSIFETTYTFDSVISCIEIITNLVSTPVREDDGLSPKICTKCISKLKCFYLFKKQCEESYKTQLHNYNTTEQNFIKEEIPDMLCKNELDSLDESLELENIKVEFNGCIENGANNLDDIVENLSNDEDPITYDDDDIFLSEIKNKHKSRNKISKKYKTTKKKTDKTIEILGVDVNTLQTKNGQFQCNQCPRIINCKRSFIRHLEKHLGIKSFFCEICQKYYAREWVHMQTHLKPRIKKYKCDKCESAFEQKGAFNLHVKSHNDEKPHVCDNCGKAFKRIDRLRAHVKIHTAVKEFLCQYCSREFQLQKNLITHIMYKHSTEKKYQCAKCDKKFSTGNCLTRHERRHLGIKNYHCQYCEKSFVDKGSLSTHLLLHTKEKRHACRVCGVKFKRTDHRNRHEMTAHGMNFRTHKSLDVENVPLISN